MSRFADLVIKEDRSEEEDRELHVLAQQLEYITNDLGTVIGPGGTVARLRAGSVVLDNAGMHTYLGGVETGRIEADGDFFLGTNIAAPATTSLAFFSNAQTYNSESIGSGDLLLGDNSASKANMLWDKSTGNLVFRSGTTIKAIIEANAYPSITFQRGTGNQLARFGAISTAGNDASAYVMSNIYYDGSDWNLDDTSANGSIYNASVVTVAHQFRYVAAASNPVAPETLLELYNDSTGAVFNTSHQSHGFQVRGKGNDLQVFDEGIADFDAVSPAWDKEVDAVGDFDAETDVDGDLNDAVAAAHDGAVGLELTYDNQTVAFGTMNASAIDQTSGCFSFWFNANDVGAEAAYNVQILTTIDGTPAVGWSVAYQLNSDILLIYHTPDGGALTFKGATSSLGAGWHHVLFAFNRSSSDGADDGWMRLYVDDALGVSATGLDDDTKDWDNVRAGIVDPSTPGSPTGSFYMDTIKIDPVGAPFASKLAVKNGTYGLAVPIMETTARYAEFTNPNGDTGTQCEFWFDPNTITMANNDSVVLCRMLDGTAIGGEATNTDINFGYSGSSYTLGVVCYDDAAYGYTIATGTTITDGWHHVRLVVKQADVGADNGYTHLYIDYKLVGQSLIIDNDQKNVDTIQFGAVAGLDAGTYDIFYMDDCKWSRLGGIRVTNQGALATNTLILSAAGPTDDLDVTGVNTIFVDTSSNNVTLGGTKGGVHGQQLNILVHDATRNFTIENEEGVNQEFRLHAGGDETMTAEHGGWVFINMNGDHWHDASHAKHV